MNQLYSSLDKAGLMFKRCTDQNAETFILLETTKNGTTEVDINRFEVTFEDVKGIQHMKPCLVPILIYWRKHNIQ